MLDPHTGIASGTVVKCCCLFLWLSKPTSGEGQVDKKLSHIGSEKQEKKSKTRSAMKQEQLMSTVTISVNKSK